MNHQRHYDKLIERARTRPLLEDYFEFHHVIPGCMDGMDLVCEGIGTAKLTNLRD